MAEDETWPNGVPKISEPVRAANLADVDALRGLIESLWLYIGRYEETQLTTEQKELLADVVEQRADRDEPYEYERWWRN
jgi:hypothetical protein